MNNDSALFRAIRTGVQAIVGVLVGLAATIWAVPGVPEATVLYLTSNALSVAVAVGIPAGMAAFVWNYLRKDVPNFPSSAPTSVPTRPAVRDISNDNK